MNQQEIEAILGDVEFEDYEFDVLESSAGLFLQASYFEPDIITGELELQKTRKWYLSGYAVKSEIVQTAFKCVITSLEHRAREGFMYRNHRIFGPHFDVDSLVELCEARKLDYRGKKKSATPRSETK